MNRTLQTVSCLTAFALISLASSQASADVGGTSRECHVKYSSPSGTYLTCSTLRLTSASPRFVNIDGYRTSTNTVCSVLVYPWNANILYGAGASAWLGSVTQSPGTGAFVTSIAIPTNVTGYVEINCWTGNSTFPFHGWNIQ